MGKVVEIDSERSMKLETSPNVTKSKRRLHWCRSISKKISVQVLLQALITLSGVFYYIIGHVLQYRAFITLSVGKTPAKMLM